MPKRNIPPMNHLRAFEAAVRHESFTKAAAELNVTQGAVSRHIRVLENYLGFELFERVNNNLIVSAEARQYADVLTRTFDRIDRATQALRQAKRRTVLAVHGYTNFLVSWLIPKLPDFVALHPEVEVRLSSGRTDVDFAQDAVDLAIQHGEGDWGDLHAHLLFPVEMVPACTPALAQALPLRVPADLLRATLYHVYFRRGEWPEWFAQVSDVPFAPAKVVHPEDAAIVQQCVLAGMGVGLCQRQYILDDVRAGRLVIPFDVPLRGSGGFYLVCPPDRADAGKVVVFREWILQQVAQEATRLAAPSSVQPAQQPV